MNRLFVSLLFVFSATAQVVPDHFIVELNHDPVARVAAKRHCRLLRNDAEFAAERTAIRTEQRRLRNGIEAEGAQVLDTFETVHNAFVVRMSQQRAARLRGLAGVKAVRPVRVYHALLDHSLPLQKVTDAWQRIGGMDKAGAGIKIGIIDTGISASHPGFQAPDLAIPDGFPKVNRESDLAYTNHKVIVARAYTNPSTGADYPAEDIDGHGTAVAMTAAGVTNTGPFGPITGVAPRAWLGNYKVFADDDSGAYDSVILRALEDAVNDGMDVINWCLGGFPAVRPVDDDLVIAIENAVAAGKVIVVAAGNDGSDMNTIASPATAPSAISVGSTANDRIFAGKVITDAGTIPAVPGDGPNSPSPIAAPLKDVGDVDPTALACSDLPSDSLKGYIAVISRGTCNFSDKLQNVQRAGAVAAIIYSLPENPTAPAMGVSGVKLPAVAVANSFAGALRDAAKGNQSATIDFTIGPVSSNSAILSSFSARGPSADYSIKPDLLAVGQTIYTAEPDSAYTVISGTSFSSPTVAGAAALLMSARPGLTVPQYRSLLINAASTFSVDGTHPLADQMGGTGLLNMTNSLSNTVTATPVSLSFGVGGDTVNANRTVTITNLGTNSDTFSIAAQPNGDGPFPTLSRNTVELAPGQSADVAVKFEAGGLAGGAYEGVLEVRGTQSDVVTHVPYWYAVPSQKPTYIQVFSPPESVRRNQEFDVQFRVVDSAGVPVTQGVDQSIVSTDIGTVVYVETTDYEVPGSYVVHMRAPRTRGTMTVHFEAGGITNEVQISVQ